MHTSIFLFAGLLFTQTLLGQAVSNATPAAAAADSTASQQVVAEPVEQPASTNATAVAATDAVAEVKEDAGKTAAAGTPFESSPYPVILEKMPFGIPPDPNALNAAATSMDEAKMKVEQQKLADTFSWTAINITPEGKTAIGFTDLSAKPPASYYMTVGDSANNWKVVEADYATETATIEKDGVRISLKFGNKSPITPTAPGAAPGTPPTPAVTPPLTTAAAQMPGLTPPTPQPVTEVHTFTSSPGGDRSSRTTSLGHSSFVTSYRDRLNARLKAEETQKQETDRKQKEDLAKIVTDALRKQQEEAAAAAAAQQQQGEAPAVPAPQIEVQVQ